MYNKNQIQSLQQELLDGCFMSGSFPGQILTAVGFDANNEIYLVTYVIVEEESKASWCWFLNLLGEDLAITSVFPSVEHRFCVKHILENMKSQFKGGLYKDMLWNAARATTAVEFNKKMAQFKSYNNAAYAWLIKISAEQWSRSHFLGSCSYRHETWAHVYLFKINPCNGKEMWLVVESRLVIISPIHKPQVSRPPKKRNKSNDKLASQSCSSGNISRKGKSVKCSKCRNLGHNRKGCKSQGGASQVGGSSQQSQGARKAASARNISSQAAGSSQ
ncbi:mutator type transposase [Tanacetum coccineum]